VPRIFARKVGDPPQYTPSTPVPAPEPARYTDGAPEPDRDHLGRYREEMDPREAAVRQFGQQLEIKAYQYPKYADDLHRLAAEAAVHGTLTFTRKDMNNGILAPLVNEVTRQDMFDSGRVQILDHAASRSHLEDWDRLMSESEAGETGEA
jgi:hypothetical protein